jgi:hypothetical protein
MVFLALKVFYDFDEIEPVTAELFDNLGPRFKTVEDLEL